METSVQTAGETIETVDVANLPPPEPLRTWAGHGTGELCNGCGGAITESEIEYEVELPAGSNVPTLHFHIGCYRDWTGRAAR